MLRERPHPSDMLRGGMLRNLLTKLYDGEAGIAGDGPNPGASQQPHSASLRGCKAERWRR